MPCSPLPACLAQSHSDLPRLKPSCLQTKVTECSKQEPNMGKVRAQQASYEMVSTADHNGNANRWQKKISKRNAIKLIHMLTILSLCFPHELLENSRSYPFYMPRWHVLSYGRRQRSLLGQTTAIEHTIWLIYPVIASYPLEVRCWYTGREDGHWRRAHAHTKLN